MNDYRKRKCNRSLATSCINELSSEEEVEVGRTSPFAELDEVVEKGALEIDNGVVEKVCPLSPHFSSILMQWEEKEWSALGESWSNCAAKSLLGQSQYVMKTMKAWISFWTWLAVDRVMRAQSLRVLASGGLHAC